MILLQVPQHGWLPEHIRWVSLTLLVLCIAGMTANMVYRRMRVIRRTRRIFNWIYLFMLNAAYGIGSNIHDHIRVNWPVYINVVILFCLLIAILWHPDGDDNIPNDDGAITSRFVLWLDRRVRQAKDRHNQQLGV